MTNATPGWYPDPEGTTRVRWWDGSQWTDQYEAPYTGSGVALTAPAGTPVYSVWIWLAVFVPYLSLPFLFTLDFSPMFDAALSGDQSSAIETQLAIMTQPGIILLTVFGWVAAAAAIVFSYLDWKWLNSVGMPKPFHWAWSFVGLAGYPVYAIGRAVVTRRRTGKGLAVLWAAIAMIVVTIIVAIGWSIWLISEVMVQMAPLMGRP